jgi:hypothetical protein
MNEEWQKGYDAGKKKSLSLNRPMKTEDFPKEYAHRSSYFFAGYAEGVIYGELTKQSKPKYSEFEIIEPKQLPESK